MYPSQHKIIDYFTIPKAVTDLAVEPERNVTRKRSMTVTWKPPRRRERNGIITKYVINYMDLHKSTTLTIEINVDSVVNDTVEMDRVIDVLPGTYFIQVTAATSKGLGESSGQNITVDPGDTQFYGTKDDFNRKIRHTYKSWFAVNNLDSIPPYIATPSDWKPNCASTSGNRKRRATTDESMTYIIGEQGDCEGVSSQGYCNGELQPGRTYRVKTVACTAGGCTESSYSEPISTESDSTAVVVIVVTIVILLMAAGGAGVVLYIMRIRRKALKYEEMNERHKEVELKPTAEAPVFRSSPVLLSEFPAYVDKLHANSDLLFAGAFNLVHENSPKHPTTASAQECCRVKNRYTNIIPFDHSRVKLVPLDDVEGSDFINANYIPGYNSRREFIASQGPLKTTFNDFWRMIWEQNVGTIVMLTQLEERGRTKCDKYWPDQDEPVYYGNIVVSVISESNMSDYIVKIFEVKLNGENRMVRHFSYLKWPDMGCPESPQMFLEYVKAVRLYSNPKLGPLSGPKIVHCSDGVGRTGTYIAVDHLLQHILKHDQVDIYNTVMEMRYCRLNMVQTVDQYVYIHECIKACITNGDDEEDDEEEEGEEEGENIYDNTRPGAQLEHAYANTAFSKI